VPDEARPSNAEDGKGKKDDDRAKGGKGKKDDDRPTHHPETAEATLTDRADQNLVDVGAADG
jgi:hypothetical protein